MTFLEIVGVVFLGVFIPVGVALLGHFRWKRRDDAEWEKKRAAIYEAYKASAKGETDDE